jgi:hypothetical protein
LVDDKANILEESSLDTDIKGSAAKKVINDIVNACKILKYNGKDYNQ